MAERYYCALLVMISMTLLISVSDQHIDSEFEIKPKFNLTMPMMTLALTTVTSTKTTDIFVTCVTSSSNSKSSVLPRALYEYEQGNDESILLPTILEK